MSSNAYRTAIIQLIAQLRARGQSGQYILYQVMGLSSIDEPVPEGELLLPLGVVVAQLKRLYGVTS